MPTHTADNESLSLSDDDVNAIYQIVHQAQESRPADPLPALFNIYYEIKSQDTSFDPQGKYPQFLRRMREPNVTNNTLFGRFQAQLRQINIDVELDEDGPEISDITRHLDLASLETHGDFRGQLFQTAGDGLGTEDPRSRPPRSRSASFSEVHETLFENSLLSDQEKDGHLTRRRKRASSRASEPGGRKKSRPRIPYPHRDFGAGMKRGRAMSDDLTYASHRRSGSTSSQGSLRITRKDHFNFAASRSQHPTESDFIPSRDSSPKGFNVPSHMLYQPSYADVLDDAEIFFQNRVLRRFLRRWNGEAKDVRSHNDRMQAAAIKFDRDTLLRQSVGIWRAALQERKQAHQTERFFGALEKRAARARDLYLLTKAFTHWAQCAADEVQRTSVARRHILRTKYFNAWKDITAVNELKVRRLGLKKYFKQWRARSQAFEEAEQRALSRYHGNLAERIYRQWFWHFCERRAPVLFTGRLCRNYLHKWHRIARQLRQREEAVQRMWNDDVRRKTISTWLRRLNQCREQQAQAVEFRRERLLRSNLSILSRESDPYARQFFETTELRLLWTIFQQWQRATSLSVKAREHNQRRVTTNAWTVWNERLRARVVEKDINHRVKAEAMYRWLLATRCRGMQWVHEQHLIEKSFHIWAQKSRNRTIYFEQAARTVESLRRNRLLRSYFKPWSNQTRKRLADHTIVNALYEQRLMSSGLQALSRTMQHQKKLEEVASIARLYFPGKLALNNWRSALQEKFARKRRDAYSYLRVKYKMNLVRDAFRTWQGVTAHVTELGVKAIDFTESKTTARQSRILLSWREQSTRQLDNTRAAERFRTEKLTGNTMNALLAELRKLQHSEEQAQEIRTRRSVVTAKTCLRTLSRTARQLGYSEEIAEKSAARFETQHRINMIRHWASWAMRLRQGRAAAVDLPLRPRSAMETTESNPAFAATRPIDVPFDEEQSDDESEEPIRDDDTNALARAEDWTVFDNSVFQDLSRLDLNFNFNSVVPGTPAPAHIGMSPGPSRTNTAPPTQSALRPRPSITPAYLQTPSKHSIAAALSSEQLLRLTNRTGGPSIGTPAPALRISRPSARGALSAPPVNRFGTPQAQSADAVGTSVPKTALGKRTAGSAFAGLQTPAPVVEEEEEGEGNEGEASGITSFQRRLRKGGYADRRAASAAKSGIPRPAPPMRSGLNRRVEFEDIQES